MKKILVTSTDLMMIQFLVPHVLYLRECGYHVEVACSEVGGRIEEVRNILGVDTVYKISLVRSPINPTNIKGLSELKELFSKSHFDLIWTNEPVMGIMTRLAAIKTRRSGTKVLYITHGYHFFKGCPAKFKIFYPIEKLASYFCDAIATINWEDYKTTSDNFHVKKTYHIDGIGLDVTKFKEKINKDVKRRELNIPQDSFVVLSVGELKPHKNHQIIIRAIASLHRKDVVYVICGKGELLESLKKLSAELGVLDQVFFLGYRRDIPEIMHCSDVFAFPSVREGLGLASLEAMAAGLPVIGTDTRGIRDYIVNGKTGYLCESNNEEEFATAIARTMDNSNREYMSKQCQMVVDKYDIHVINQSLESIIDELLI